MKITLRKLFASIFVQLCGAAGVGGEVSAEKNNPNIFIELIFRGQNSQKVETKFTVPTKVGKTLVNGIWVLFSKLGV